MITYPENNQNTQVRRVNYNDSPIMRVMADNKQVYPNGIYAYCSYFPRVSNYFIATDIGGILTPNTWAKVSSSSSYIRLKEAHIQRGTDFPTLAKNQTINGVSGYDVFRLYTPSGVGWSWVKPDASLTDDWIGVPTIKCYNVYNDEKNYTGTSFNFPSGHNDLVLNSMVSRRFNLNGTQPDPFYIYVWDSHQTLVANMGFGKLHTIPAGSYDANREFFESKSTSLPTWGKRTENRSYYIAMAVKDNWEAQACALELSFHFSV